VQAELYRSWATHSILATTYKHSADFLVHTLRSGDAIGQHTIELARLLGSAGMAVRIHSSYGVGPVPGDIAPLAQSLHYADYVGATDLTILQYGHWFPLAERFQQTPGRRIFWYHGVTPPPLWTDAATRGLLRNAQVRTNLAWDAHLVVATSPFSAAELQHHCGYPEERVRIIPLGVDVDALAQQPDPALLMQLRLQWRLQGKRVILYVGRIAGNKRVDLIIAAYAQLCTTFPDLHLLIVGDTQNGVVTQQLTMELRRQAEKLGVAEGVTFTGRVPDVEPYYHLADVYVQASQHEGFGVPLIEAMAAGLAVVAVACGALPWLLGASQGNNAPSGLLVSPASAGELAQQIARLLQEPQLVQALVQRGRTRAAEFSSTQFATNVQALLDEAMSLTPHRAFPTNPHQGNSLYEQADIAMRAYKVKSKAPLVARLIEWIRTNSTLHLTEGYLDPVVEQQVNYNRMLAQQLASLKEKISRLQPGAAKREPQTIRKPQGTHRGTVGRARG
jgi:glycosyltransferase involved in cell wall biosynthesis